jgi:hypothetical protein
MTIDEAYSLCKYVANKDQNGNTFKPAQFNMLAKVAQMDFISKRLGNVKLIGQSGSTPFGYQSNRKVHEDLRPLVYGPVGIHIQPNTGLFTYPYGYIWPDAVHKLDWTPIWEVATDEYPHVKKSTVIPPSSDYPVVVHRGAYGYIDPYTIGMFGMSYVKMPADPIWNYTVVNNEEVYNPIGSVDFQVSPNSHFELVLTILQMAGVNLDMPMLLQYADQKEQITG